MSQKSILIVEDDRDIRVSLGDVLVDEGYLVHLAANGREALQALETISPLPGLILLDAMMPEMDGYGFRRAQLADARIAGIPTVLFSADGQAERKTTELRFAEHIKKPVDLDVLFDAAKRYCG